MRVDGTVASDDDGGRSGGGPDYGSAWARVKRRLRAELGEDVFASWFARLELRGRGGRPASRFRPASSRAGSSRTTSIAC